MLVKRKGMIMFNFKRYLLIFACFIIDGCILDCSNEYINEYTEYVPAPASGGGGIVNDSMALFDIVITDYYCCGGAFGAGGGEEFRFRESNLTLADIRTEKIYWQKKIPAQFYYINIIDSVLFIFQNHNGDKYYIDQIAVHRLGDKKFQEAKQVELNYKRIGLNGEGWKYSSIRRVRPWQNGLILANYFNYFLGNIINKYALIDTIAGTFELWDPSGKFEWMNECSDVKWSRTAGLCLKEIPDTLGFVLLKNGVDTLAIRYMPPETIATRYTEDFGGPLIFNGNHIISRGWIYLLDELWQVSEKPLDVFASRMGEFYDLYGNEAGNYYKKILY